MTPSLFNDITDANRVNPTDNVLRLTIGIHLTSPTNNEVILSNGELFPKPKFLSYEKDGLSVYSVQKLTELGEEENYIYNGTSPVLVYLTSKWNVGEMINKTSKRARAKFDPVSDANYPAKGEAHVLIITENPPPDKIWNDLRKDFYSAIKITKDSQYDKVLMHLAALQLNQSFLKK